MNRRERRKMVRDTAENSTNLGALISNHREITEILKQRYLYTLKEYGIPYYISKNEVRTNNDKRAQEIYDQEAQKLLNELQIVKGDYKKIKNYE
jgi:hypothetical protein